LDEDPWEHTFPQGSIFYPSEDVEVQGNFLPHPTQNGNVDVNFEFSKGKSKGSVFSLYNVLITEHLRYVFSLYIVPEAKIHWFL
jgi:hypothetical protein